MQFFILLILFQKIISQWLVQDEFMTSNVIYQEALGGNAFKKTENFVKTSNPLMTANFINCQIPLTSYITLEKDNPGIENYYQKSSQYGSVLSLDLYFHGTWNSQSVTINLGSFSDSFIYTSPNSYFLESKFCDNTPYEIQSYNNFFTASYTGKFSFSSSNLLDGKVSLKNIFITRLICYPSCFTCYGPGFNECQICFYGTPLSNICPECPNDKYYVKYMGCRDVCNFDSKLYKNQFCEEYPITYFQYSKFDFNPLNVEYKKWSINYDKKHLDPTINLGVYANTICFGIFKYNSGIQRFVNEINPSIGTQLIGLQIKIVMFGPLPVNTGINIQFNNTYYGSVYKISTQIQTHNLVIFDKISLGSYLSYNDCYQYELHMFVDIPPYQFLFSTFGNYTDGSVGWGLVSLAVTSGYCPQYCKECEISFQCKTCVNNFFKYRDGRCIYSCKKVYQKSNTTHCIDFDDETPYSKYLIQEYIDYANDPTQENKYVLHDQSPLPGINFLKGANIIYSYWKNYRVFGGPYVWAQAKFSRDHQILNSHHSITIGFEVLFGPTFPSTGSFIYKIESNPNVNLQSIGIQANDDGTKTKMVYEKISHTSNSLTIYWECYGLENEPVSSYCGFFNYYIAVHYCQPFCLQCTNENTCTQWNSTYNSNIIKFSQSQCLSNQYHDKNQWKCLNCPNQCITCTSLIDCQTCQNTYTLTKQGCVCKQNQYEDLIQCYDCPNLCKQCLSATYCMECFLSDFREPVQGQCICMQGYYEFAGNRICLQCHQFCKECSGHSNDNCYNCSDVVGIVLNGNTCECPQTTFYSEQLNSCISCHNTCLTCFNESINGCLSCDILVNRNLIGLNCECSSGYYEVSGICQSCPIVEDPSYTQCYVLCLNNQLIWHLPGCLSCDTGFQIVNLGCQPICGDLQVLGNEQCEDGNNILDDKCFNCRFQCSKNCQFCNQNTQLPCPDICGDGIVTGLEDCEDGNNIQFDGCYNCKYQCQESCTKCLKGVCNECAGGWYIDPIIWKCYERCGDLLVVGQEQCDDANLSDTDGCKECRYFCRIGCTSCNYDTNICLACEFSGFAPNQYYCQNICGDGLVVVDPYGFFAETCDDIGCKSDCKSCKSGYVLINSICQPICGDSLVVEKEMCEDVFTLPYRCQHCQTKCQLSCLVCDTTGKGCLICNIGYENIDNLCYSICGDQIITNDEDCDDGNLIIEDGCHFCSYRCSYSCLNCIKGKCLNCMDGYSLILSTCQLNCDDRIAIWNKKCDNIILINNEGCHKCIQCSDYCQICQNGLCISCQTNYELDVLYFQCKPIQISNQYIEPYCVQFKDNQCLKQRETLINFLLYSDYMMNTCFEHCKICLFNNCIECQQGYYGNTCQPKCGDNIVVQEEECDCIRGRIINECFNCKLICPSFCQVCIFGQCQQCQYGFYLDVVSNTCQSICGDNIQSLNEVCDDGNDQDYDGCSYCQYQCELECLDCQFGICTLCFESFILVQSKEKCEPQQLCEAQNGYYYESFTNSCIDLCGDGIVAGQEDCDDINDTPYDGCYQCKFQCSKLCELCDNGICLIEACPLGTITMNNSCCGDFIVNGDEECDDGNLIDFDGCSKCFFQCNQYCNTCDKGNCTSCIEGFILDRNQCFSNEYQQLENLEKKTNNSLNFDQICRNDECIFSLRPQMRLTFLNQTFSKQYVEISFDQEVQLDGLHLTDQLQIFEILIENLEEQFYYYQLQSIVSITSDLQSVQYVIEIDIQCELQEKPTLTVTLMETPSQSILLKLPKIMSEEIKQQTITISSTNKAFIIAAISISVVSLLFGEASFFIETLNILQYQSYLKFINLDYPENLYIYFQTSEMLSLSTYIDNLQIDYLLGIITRKQESQVKTDGKFEFYNVDCDLISNLIPQFFQLAIILIIVLNSKKLYIMYQNFFSTMLSNYILQNTQRCTQQIIQLILNVGKQFKKFLKFRYQFTLMQILPILSLNAWDLLFKTLLQIHYNDLSNPRQKFQYICGLSIITSYFIILLKSYNTSIPKQYIHEVYYLQNRYFISDIVRTFLFHYALVFFQDDAITQSFLIAINSILQCIFIFKYQQVNTLDKFSNIINEAAVALFSLTTYIYYQENYYPYQTILQVGFFHMGLLMISLSLVFIKQIWRKTQMIFSQLIKWRKKEKTINHDIFL